MKLPSVPSPRDVRWLVEQALAVAPRATNLLTGAESLVAQAGGIVAQVQALLVRMEGLLEEVDGTRVRADEVIEGVQEVRARASDSIDGIEEVRLKADRAIGGVEEVRDKADRAIGGVEEVRDKADRAIGGVDDVRARASDMVDQAQRIADKGERAMGGLDDVRARADALLTRVENGAVGRMLELAERLEPSLAKLEPVLVHLAETTSPEEIDAVVAMVDKLPRLEQSLKEDVLPMLATLSTVAPDMHQMLEVTQELSELVLNLPGMGRIKKKVEDQQD